MSPVEVANDDEDDVDSLDEALCEILGLTLFDGVVMDDDDEDHDDLQDGRNDNKWDIPQCVTITRSVALEMQQVYQSQSVCILPQEWSIPSHIMRRLTDELLWGRDDNSIASNKTYETIRLLNRNTREIEQRRTLTRLENFVNGHSGWKELCHGHLQRCVSAVTQLDMLLYKEKLNLKPPGGSGFAPHLDTPSLRVALGESGPQAFVTVMVAIDNMTRDNGCLRIAKGAWNEDNHVPVMVPDDDGNPDAGGRAGAIASTVTESLDFQDIECRGGDIVIFNGWAPHRSAANASPFPRRAVFLTYNPVDEGDFHDTYYERMNQLRNDWKARVGLAGRRQLTSDEQRELDALATVPR